MYERIEPIMTKTQKLTLTAVLAAIGMLLPFSPLRLIIPPGMTITVALHVPIFIAMFISPWSAVSVVLMQTAVFFPLLGPAVGLRSLSHLIFAVAGSIYIRKRGIPKTIIGSAAFCMALAVIHAIAEILVIAVLFFPSPEVLLYHDAYFTSPITHLGIAVGLGTIIHSTIDYMLAMIILGSIPQFRRKMKGAK